MVKVQLPNSSDSSYTNCLLENTKAILKNHHGFEVEKLSTLSQLTEFIQSTIHSLITKY